VTPAQAAGYLGAAVRKAQQSLNGLRAALDAPVPTEPAPEPESAPEPEPVPEPLPASVITDARLLSRRPCTCPCDPSKYLDCRRWQAFHTACHPGAPQ
jgi:hypothetical protein